MKKFITHVVLTIGLFWLLSALITGVLYTAFSKKDFYSNYELNEILTKQNVMLNWPEKINTVFIGSSLTYRQIIPSVFDSITNNSSFNMGFESFFPYRSYDALTEILKTEKGKDINNIFIELAPPDFIAENYNNSAYLYSINFEKYKTAMQTSRNPNLSQKAKFYIFTYWNISFMYKYSGFSISKYINLLLHLNPPLAKEDPEYRKTIIDSRGFIDLNTQEIKFDNGLTDSERKDFLRNGEEIDKELIQEYKHSLNVSYSPDDFTKYILKYSTELRKQGKNVYFIIPPRKLIFEKYSLNQKKFLEQNQFKVVDLSDPDIYPDFYKYDLSYNKTHLNYQGARIYTQTLANLVKSYK